MHMLEEDFPAISIITFCQKFNPDLSKNRFLDRYLELLSFFLLLTLLIYKRV